MIDAKEEFDSLLRRESSNDGVQHIWPLPVILTETHGDQ